MSQMMMEFIYSVLGHILLWSAINVGRKEDSKVKIFSKKWVLQMTLIVSGALIVKLLL